MQSISKISKMNDKANQRLQQRNKKMDQLAASDPKHAYYKTYAPGSYDIRKQIEDMGYMYDPSIEKTVNESMKRYQSGVEDKNRYNTIEQEVRDTVLGFYGPNQSQDRLRKELSKEARDFEGKAGGYADQLYGLYENEAKAQLKEGLRSTRRNFNDRGLLYSGLRQAGEGELRGQVASGLAAERVNINKEMSDLARSKKQVASSVGLETYNQAAMAAEQLYNQQLSNALMRRKALGQIGKGIGYGVGAVYGSKDDEQNDEGLLDS